MSARLWCSWGQFDMSDVFEDCPNAATVIVTVRNGPTVTSSAAYCDKHAGDRRDSLAHKVNHGITVSVDPIRE